MSNELILILSVCATFSAVLLCFKFLQKQGLYLWIVVATITANIEVMLLVRAFGIDMTLGNILFASTFLATDILSELYGRKDAERAVLLGACSAAIFFVISYSWRFYDALPAGCAAEFQAVFSHTPRILFASLSVYLLVQFFDVWCYHKLWDFTTRLCNNSRAFLWFRNNVATILAQFINSVLFTLGAFYGIYEAKILWSIIISSFAIFFVTSLADTPFLYLARKIADKGTDKQK